MLRTYELPYLILGGALASTTALARVKSMDDSWIDNPEAMRLYNAILSGEKVKVKEWIERHACPYNQANAFDSLLAWAEKLCRDSKRDRLLAELQTKSLAELESLVEGNPVSIPIRQQA